ncbi:MAG: hypothetical protein ABR562_04430 [Thermoplasmatota archaeon]
MVQNSRDLNTKVMVAFGFSALMLAAAVQVQATGISRCDAASKHCTIAGACDSYEICGEACDAACLTACEADPGCGILVDQIGLGGVPVNYEVKLHRDLVGVSGSPDEPCVTLDNIDLVCASASAGAGPDLGCTGGDTDCWSMNNNGGGRSLVGTGFAYVSAAPIPASHPYCTWGPATTSCNVGYNSGSINWPPGPGCEVTNTDVESDLGAISAVASATCL